MRNVLINGSGDFWQRQVAAATLTNCSNNNYASDRWKVLTQTASVQMAQVSGPISPYALNAIRMSQNQAAAQRSGIIQFLENKDTYFLRNIPMRFEGQVRISSSQPVHFAIVEWTGTADAPTTNVVNDWTSSTYSAGNFFLSSNVVVSNHGSITPNANVWTTFACDATPSIACNNVAVMIWSEGTMAQNVTLDFAVLQFHREQTSALWNPLSCQEEFGRCLRYCVKYKNGAYTTALAYANNDIAGCMSLPVPMRASPTISVNSQSDFAIWDGSSNQTSTGAGLTIQNFNGNSWGIDVVTTVGLTQGNAALFYNNSSSTYILLDCDF